MRPGKKLLVVSLPLLSSALPTELNVMIVQETFLTKEEAIASSVEDTFVSPLTGLPVVE
jgi:hypothetical protein